MHTTKSYNAFNTYRISCLAAIAYQTQCFLCIMHSIKCIVSLTKGASRLLTIVHNLTMYNAYTAISFMNIMQNY
jgi:hypothetical protein